MKARQTGRVNVSRVQSSVLLFCDLGVRCMSVRARFCAGARGRGNKSVCCQSLAWVCTQQPRSAPRGVLGTALFPIPVVRVLDFESCSGRFLVINGVAVLSRHSNKKNTALSTEKYSRQLRCASSKVAQNSCRRVTCS
jgi:hypothetical protein